jgi:hypothetical protein
MNKVVPVRENFWKALERKENIEVDHKRQQQQQQNYQQIAPVAFELLLNQALSFTHFRRLLAD